MVKNLRLLSYVMIFILGFSASGRTLQELAQTSNLLLVLADRLASESDSEVKKRSCGMSHEQISARSQKLKSLIDQKIASLTAGDFHVLETRVKTCDWDCTCDIYALAFESKDKPHAVLEKKSSQITPAMREKCVAKIKKICQRAKS